MPGCLARREVLQPEPPCDLPGARSLLEESLHRTDTADVVGEAPGETEGLFALQQLDLAGRKGARHVAHAPRVAEREVRRLLHGRREGLHLPPADALPRGPGGDLLDLALERAGVVADELDEPAGRVVVDADARALELHPHPGREVVDFALPGLALGHVEAEDSPRGPARRLETRELRRVAHEREHRARRGTRQVANDRLGVRLLPALDPLDDDEPLPASEEAERVRRRDHVLSGGGLGEEMLDRPLGKARAQPAEGERDLRQIAAGDQVGGLERLCGHLEPAYVSPRFAPSACARHSRRRPSRPGRCGRCEARASLQARRGSTASDGRSRFALRPR